MRRLSALFSAIILGGFALPANGSEAAQPNLKGNWDITICPNPDRVCVITRCFQFARIKGTVNGLPNSGTWTSPGADVLGQWAQYGDTVQFFVDYALGPGNFGFVTFTGFLAGPDNMGGVSFIEADLGYSLSNTGTWNARRVESCPPFPPTATKLRRLFGGAN